MLPTPLSPSPVLIRDLRFVIAVKAGGMRITQHKAPGAVERPAKDQEDCTGLTNPPNINSELVSGAPIHGLTDYSEEATKVAHAPKPVQNVAHKPVPHIQQPRK